MSRRCRLLFKKEASRFQEKSLPRYRLVVVRPSVFTRRYPDWAFFGQIKCPDWPRQSRQQVRLVVDGLTQHKSCPVNASSMFLLLISDFVVLVKLFPLVFFFVGLFLYLFVFFIFWVPRWLFTQKPVRNYRRCRSTTMTADLLRSASTRTNLYTYCRAQKEKPKNTQEWKRSLREREREKNSSRYAHVKETTN